MFKAYVNSLNLVHKVTDHLETEDQAQAPECTLRFTLVSAFHTFL